MRSNNWPLIKVCGIQTIGEAKSAILAGANTIGLLIGLTHKAEDRIGASEGFLISDEVKGFSPGVRVTLVTHLTDPEELLRIAEFVEPTAIQVHDNMTPENMGTLRTMLPYIEIFKAIHITGSGPEATTEAIEKAGLYAPYVDAFFTDSKSVDPDGQLRIGGTGKRHDPTVARNLVSAFPAIPIVLAGGLNPDNVAMAISEVRPAGIDANSGLEDTSGKKDFMKMKAFAEAGKRLLEQFNEKRSG
jgi:phosphoribosylanthranilate isomerase